MRFIVREGSDPFARADSALLSAMGLPGGGIISVGKTHVAVRPGDVPQPTALTIGPRAMANAGVREGETVDAKRAMLPQARRVVIAEDDLPLEPQQLAHSLQGIPVTPGDVVEVDRAYASEEGDEIILTVSEVDPDGPALVGNATVVAGASVAGAAITEDTMSTAEALLAGLDTEVDVLSGWLSLLTSAGNLPTAWGLPKVAGVVVDGPAGVGKSELVAAAAEAAGAEVNEISLELVFKPEKLLEALEKAVSTTSVPAVIFVDRIDAVVGDDGMFRTQTSAIMRWFLDAVAERPRLATVLGISGSGDIDDALMRSPLLPRRLTIPPPNVERRRLLFEAALAKVPSEELDYAQLAARTAGFSGADILAAVVNASAMVSRGGKKVSDTLLLDAVRETPPSLGTAQLGEVPTYGFERVANLTEVKQRLTEAVIWPVTEPERFERLNIEPPRGLLLYGPPGTGKTFVIRALAHESGAAFFAIKGAELLDKFVGESERGVREVFARARAAAPSILFFDEIDALAPVRGRSTTTVNDSVVAALLTELDGVGDRGDIVVIGATNRKDLIDPALLRGGRFEVHIELGLPVTEARRALLGISDVPFADDVDLDDVAEATEGLSFADLVSALREAALNALRRDSSALDVTRADIDAALARPRA
ncbi:MAG: AAA family ATPase [Acidimicrobiia bacterium]|nr:AAA family ATPase [Acidimicrobiia bacterium]